MQAMTNGNGDHLTAATSESDLHARQMVEEGLNAVARIQQDRDSCAKQLLVTGSQLRGVETELAALNLAYQRLLTEIDEYRRQRDHAVARRAEVEAVFNAALDLMQKHRGRPLVEETAPADEPMCDAD
jgi:molecular chaperone GrpE (heat shock protein)